MDYLAYFASGLLISNGIPHFINGISGRKFQSPFASPPGIGVSSPLINVIWGMVNFVLGYLLLAGVGNFAVGISLDSVLFGLGSFLMALFLSWHFGRVRTAME